MAKKGNRVQVILECTEHKTSGMPVLHVTLLRRIRKYSRSFRDEEIQSDSQENDRSQKN